jgi:hypothetical protein
MVAEFFTACYTTCQYFYGKTEKDATISNGKIRFQKFMIGIYGIYKLANYLLYGGLAIVVLFNLLNWPIGGFFERIAVILGYYRTFSRNRSKRYQENQKFLTFK